MKRKFHVRCRTGEKMEIVSKSYLSLYVILKMGKLLKEEGYDVKVLNLVNFKLSMHYNPFDYIKSEKDILTFARALIENTKAAGEKEDFWTRSEQMIYQAMIGYIHYEVPKEEQNMATLIAMLDMLEAGDEDGPAPENYIDQLFAELEERDPDHFAVRQYRKFKQAAGKTLQSILVCAAVRMSVFDIKEVRELMSKDDMALDTLADHKTALFIITSDTDKTFNFIAAMLYTQLFNQLCYTADYKYGGKLPMPVHCILDEFSNIGKIPDFEILISTIRSRRISAMIFLQSKSQFNLNYKDSAGTIEDNCDTLLFLGGKSKDTVKDLSELLGKETIDVQNTSESHGQNGSTSVSQQRTGRELLTQDEIAVLDGDKCICQIRGTRPFLSDKYDTANHPMYKRTGYYDEANMFDLEEHLRPYLNIKANTEFEFIEVS